MDHPGPFPEDVRSVKETSLADLLVRSVTTLLDLVGTLARLHGRTPEILHAAPRLGDIRHSLGDPARAEAALGVSAGVRLDEGLSRLRRG